MKLDWGLLGVVVMKRWMKRKKQTYNLWTTTSIGDFANQDTHLIHTPKTRLLTQDVQIDMNKRIQNIVHNYGPR